MATRLKRQPVGAHQLHDVYRVTYDELIDAATTQTLDLATLPADHEVEMVWLDIVTAFADAGSISAIGVEVGSTADPNSLVTSTELLSGPPSTGRVRADGAGETGSGLAMKAKFTATGANFGDGATSDVDAGVLDIHVVHRRYR